MAWTAYEKISMRLDPEPIVTLVNIRDPLPSDPERAMRANNARFFLASVLRTISAENPVDKIPSFGRLVRTFEDAESLSLFRSIVTMCGDHPMHPLSQACSAVTFGKRKNLVGIGCSAA